MIGHTHNLSPYLKDLIGERKQQGELEKLALEVLELVRSTLMLELHFLDRALLELTPVSSSATKSIATDGQAFCFYPVYILRGYRQAREGIVRDFLHTVLHCVFRHPYVGKKVRASVWDLACDIAVEGVITELGLSIAASSRQERQADALARLKEEVYPLTAEKLYAFFQAQGPEAAEDFVHLHALFQADDHAIWYEDAGQGDGSGTESDRQEEDQDESEGSPMSGLSGRDEVTAPPESGEATPGMGGGEDSGGSQSSEGGSAHPAAENALPDAGAGSPFREEMDQRWKDIGQRVQMELETLAKSWGEGSGSLIQQLRAVNRERYDYTAFLRRFAVLGESMEVNEEEFDLTLYTYGLKLFGNLPLVEPLEHREVQRIRDFVIVLDTSQSVAGRLVQTFVNKTYNILQQTESFFSRINLHIIQCGASVQEDHVITCREEFDAYLNEMRLYGFGGTDFRPAFAYVDQLIREHAFTALRGLLYFTDGYGTFPARRPEYEAAFVFCTDREDPPQVPPWAIRLMLPPEELQEPSWEGQYG